MVVQDGLDIIVAADHPHVEQGAEKDRLIPAGLGVEGVEIVGSSHDQCVESAGDGAVGALSRRCGGLCGCVVVHESSSWYYNVSSTDLTDAERVSRRLACVREIRFQSVLSVEVTLSF